jgi:hypothetical protein
MTFTARGGNGFVRSLAYEYVNQDAATSAFTSINREITGGFDVGLCLAGIRYPSVPLKADPQPCLPGEETLYSLGPDRHIVVWINHNVVDLLDVSTSLPLNIEELRMQQDSRAPVESTSPCSGSLAGAAGGY